MSGWWKERLCVWHAVTCRDTLHCASNFRLSLTNQDTVYHCAEFYRVDNIIELIAGQSQCAVLCTSVYAASTRLAAHSLQQAGFVVLSPHDKRRSSLNVDLSLSPCCSLLGRVTFSSLRLVFFVSLLLPFLSLAFLSS